MPRRPPLAILLALAVLAGCDGGKPPSVAGCLGNRGFLVEADGNVVRGSSPAGVNFTLTLYATPAAARAARGASGHRAAIPVVRALVDDRGNPPGANGTPRRLSKRALAEIRACVTHA